MKLVTPIEPVYLEAILFMGWENAEEVCRSIPNAFYVPKGHAHSMRYPGEVNSSGTPNADAVDYLVVRPKNQTAVRASVGWWIVADKHSHVDIYPPDTFNRAFKMRAADEED